MPDKPSLPLWRKLIAAALLAGWGWGVVWILRVADGMASGLLGLPPVGFVMATAADLVHAGVFLALLAAVALLLDRIFSTVLTLLESAPFRVTVGDVRLFRLCFCLGVIAGFF